MLNKTELQIENIIHDQTGWLIPRQTIYSQKQSHNRDFPLELLCKFPLIGSVFN